MKKVLLTDHLIILVFISLFLFSCSNSKTKLGKEGSDSTEIKEKQQNRNVNNYFKLPSPSELFLFLKDYGGAFNKSMLNPVSKVSKYNTTISKSLNFGVYASDLFLCTVYKQNQEIMNYYNSIKTLAEGLEIVKGFDDKLSKRIDKNLNNNDSILNIITEATWNANVYLEDLGKTNILPYITYGGWIEGGYVATKMVNKFDSKNKVVQMISDQRFLLDNLIGMFESIDKDEYSPQYVKKLKDLQKLFDLSTDELKKDQFEKIKAMLEKLRNEIIN
jgi:hypothetical protein